MNHDALTRPWRWRVARVRRVEDGRVKPLHLYLASGVMVIGVVVEGEEGPPQGGPLSALRSNLMLDDLDKELEKRDHRFVRCADDCSLGVKTQRAGERVMASTKRFIERRLKLKVNEGKSAVDRATSGSFRASVSSNAREKGCGGSRGRVLSVCARNCATSPGAGPIRHWKTSSGK